MPKTDPTLNQTARILSVTYGKPEEQLKALFNAISYVNRQLTYDQRANGLVWDMLNNLNKVLKDNRVLEELPEDKAPF